MTGLFVVALLAIAYRLRGHRPTAGALNRVMHPVFVLRPMWAAAVFAAVYLLTADLWIAAAAALGEWAGLHLRHAPGQDMGTWKGSVADDLTFMAAVGAQRGIIVLAFLLAVTYWNGAGLGDVFALNPLWWFVPALYAVTLPAAYFVGWRIPFQVPHLLRGGIEWSELLTGATRGAVFVIVFNGGAL